MPFDSATILIGDDIAANRAVFVVTNGAEALALFEIARPGCRQRDDHRVVSWTRWPHG